MPGLTLAPAVESSMRSQSRRCRIFVSYAHQDALRPAGQPLAHSLLDRFEIELKNLQRTLSARGFRLHSDEVFIDRQRLTAAPVWHAEIEQAIAQCDVLVFLVSPDSRASDFCIVQELSRVAQKGGRIVPLLLRETADWRTLDLGDGRLLGDCSSGGLPKNAIGNAMAICHPDWGDPDQAWAAATMALAEFFEVQLFGRDAAIQPNTDGSAHTKDRTSAAPLPGELPVAYFCDQLHVTDGFDDGVDAHLSRHPPGRPHALLAIVQGEYDDQPDRLVDRLHHHHLAARLQAAGVPHAHCRVPMSWPTDRSTDRPFPGRSVLRHLCETISPRLAIDFARCRQFDEAAAVIDAHFAMPSVQPVAVFALLPNRDPATAAALRYLVQCLDRCPNAQGQMAKLALYCVDELPGARAHWARAVPKARQMAALALQPLKPVGEEELHQWHFKYQLERQWPWPDCLALFRRTVAEQGAARVELRLRRWADAVQRHRPDIARLTPPLPDAAA